MLTSFALTEGMTRRILVNDSERRKRPQVDNNVYISSDGINLNYRYLGISSVYSSSQHSAQIYPVLFLAASLLETNFFLFGVAYVWVRVGLSGEHARLVLSDVPMSLVSTPLYSILYFPIFILILIGLLLAYTAVSISCGFWKMT